MRRLALLVALSAPSLLLAADGFHPLGEIQSATSSAAFDETSVRGPRVQVTREHNGRWTGRLLGSVIDGQERENGLRGAGFALYVERVKDGFRVRGNLQNRTISLYVPDDEQLRFHQRWTLKGVADTESPPPVQFALAAVGALY